MRLFLTALLLTLSLSAYAMPEGGPPGHGGDSNSTSENTNKNTNKNANVNVNVSKADSESSAKAISNSKANSNSNSSSKIKDSGNSHSSSEGGKSNNDNNVSLSNRYDATKATAASAASLSSAGCQISASGQLKDGGFASITDSPLCDALKMVHEHTVAYNATPPGEDRDAHFLAIHEFRDMADEYVRDTHATGKLATQAAQVGQTAGWAAFLVYLIL